MRVLVCGGRDYADRDFLRLALSELHRELAIACLIDGAAPGADSLAHEWAVDTGIPTERYPADWDTYGKAAGAIRNRRMLVEGKPDLVVAFPGGRGTADMVRQARYAEVKVRGIP